MPKGVLIPDMTTDPHGFGVKGMAAMLSLEDGPAGYQLVGGVTAHQGYDG